MPHTGMDLNPSVDYGVTMATPMNVDSHPARNFKPKTKTQLGLDAIGPNSGPNTDKGNL